MKRIVSLKGCHFHERRDFLKEIGVDKTHEDYRHIMGWSCQKVELLCSRIRGIGLKRVGYQFAGVRENRRLTY